MCARTVRPIDGMYHCAACMETTYTISQRIVMQVEDDSGTTTLTLFNKEAEQIVGVPLQKVLAQQVELEDVPTPVRNIVGKQFLFQIKVTTYNTKHGCEEFTVTKVSCLKKNQLEHLTGHLLPVMRLQELRRHWARGSTWLEEPQHKTT